MKNPFLPGLLVGLIGLLSFTGVAAAQIDTLWTYPAPSFQYPLHYFCGAANMDNDPGDELVYYSEEDRVIIFDGATGDVDWDSGVWYVLHIAGAVSAISVYGYSPFCDVNADGKKEITFDGSQTGTNDWRVYVVGFTGANVDGTGHIGILQNLSTSP